MGIFFWMTMSTSCPSLRFAASSSLIGEAATVCRDRLYALPSHCLEYDLLLERRYLKEKHWIYAILMAAMESLPLLYRKCTHEELLEAVLAKAYLGASSKLLDNLNDEIHTVEEALDSLENYLNALTCGIYQEKEGSPVEMAESSACEMASWIYESLGDSMSSSYVKDCTKLVEGQIVSLQHKRRGWPSLKEYITSIAEKSIGDVWIDIDLCQIEWDENLLLLKKGNEYIFKSSLVYDDVQDLMEDIRTTSVNSAVILALERGVITEDDLDTMDPVTLVGILKETGITDDTIYLADALFLKGVSTFMKMEASFVDKKGLLQSFRLVRLFNLRKLLFMNRDAKTFRRALESFSHFQSLESRIPQEIVALV